MDRTGVRYALGHHLEGLGILILRYGLLAILLWIGAFKFTATEAKAIQPLISHSPLMSWLYAVTDVQGASRLLGAAVLTAGESLQAAARGHEMPPATIQMSASRS